MNENRAIAYLGLGTLLFALGPSVLKLLTTMGGRFGVDNPGAISFCNVLFVGNVCAGLVTLGVYGARPLFSELLRLTPKTKVVLMLGAIVSTVYPALLFTALEHTTVINVVLISRFNGIVFVALAYFFFHVAVTRSEVLGYGVIACGVTALVVLNNGGLRISIGESLVLLATVFFALTEFISKRVLEECSIESYVFFRNLVSALIFFTIAVYLFGFEHFAEAFTGELWALMVVYAGLAVVAAQLLWLKATRVLPVRTIANAQLLNPAFSIFFAFVLLGEAPTRVEWVAVAVILGGTVVPRAGEWKRERHRGRSVGVGIGLVGTH